MLKRVRSLFSSFPAAKNAAGHYVGADAAVGKAAAAAAPAEDFDLFASDEEEDAEAERVKAERIAAYEAKKATSACPPRWRFLRA